MERVLALSKCSRRASLVELRERAYENDSKAIKLQSTQSKPDFRMDQVIKFTIATCTKYDKMPFKDPHEVSAA